MPSISRSKIVPYTASQMFALVNDIQRYPEFIPWCCSSNILAQTVDEMTATLCFARGSLQKCFTTCNRLQLDKMIDVRLVTGPFRRLEGYWRFDKLSDHTCKISFDMEFDFAGRLISFAFGPLFNQVANTLVDSFSKRAQQIYGKPDGT